MKRREERILDVKNETNISKDMPNTLLSVLRKAASAAVLASKKLKQRQQCTYDEKIEEIKTHISLILSSWNSCVSLYLRS